MIFFIEGEEYAEMMEISSTIGGKEEITQGLHMLNLAHEYMNTNIDCWTHYSETELAGLEQSLVFMAGNIYIEHIEQMDAAETLTTQDDAFMQNRKK